MVRCLSMVLSVVLVATSAAAGGNNAANDEFQPRKVVPKALGVVRHQETTGRLIVKFTDQAKSRSNADGTVASRNNTDVTTANNIAKAFGLKFTRAINHSEQKLATLEARAANFSRKAQPDLAGILYLDGSMGSLNAAATMLQKLPVVEYVEFEPLIGTAGGTPGACCLPNGTCTVQTATNCFTIGGTYQGDGTTCAPNPCPPPPTGACCQASGVCTVTTPQGCNVFKGVFQGVGTTCTPGLLCLPGACCILGSCQELTPPVCDLANGVFQGIGEKCDDADCEVEGCGKAGGSCFAPTPGQPFCVVEDCCQTVCSFDPHCCDEKIGEWDFICVQEANLFCDIDEGADRCNTCLVNGSCFEVHPSAGCDTPSCCNLVGAVDDFCVTVFWSSDCVLLATQLCSTAAAPGSTPNFVPLQGYRTPTPYPPAIFDDFCAGGAGIACPGPPFFGYCGEGYNLPALHQLGEDLLDKGIGEANGSQGLGIRVGVIEFGAYVDHEDLDVIPEPGQTIITIPLLTSPDHGTACLGIIGAKDNGFGVTGIAPEATLYFFPTTSVEEGGRLFSAMSSAFQTFETGDILSYSIGPGGCGTLASGLTARMLLTVGTNLGILNVIAAGNDCCNLADDDPFADDALEAGCFTIGAVQPGRPYCRLGFSNHTNVGEPHIDVSAWGSNITTTGTGDLFFGNGSPLRAYTTTFNGTSGATPLVAGALAAVQGLAKQFYGIPVVAAQYKGDFEEADDGLLSYIFQCETPDPDDLPGSPDPFECAGDFDPDAEPRWVVGFFDPVETAVSVLAATPIFDFSPLIEDFFLRRGILENGNIFSLKSPDDNFLTIRAVRAVPGDTGIGPGLAPTPPGPLLGFGLVTDMDVIGHTDGAIVEELELETRTRSTTSFTGLMFIEMFNWDLKRYEFIDFLFVTPELPDDLGFFIHTVQSPERYIRETDGEFIVRLWTVVPGNPSLTTHKIQHDFVGVTVNPGGGKG